MKLSSFLSTFHPASFESKAVWRRELARSLLVAVLVLVALGVISATVLVDSFGGRLFGQ
ncbi:MAG: hypothetical protein JWN04_6366 [Myxococcaceae bacterium]|nr:hypothetical protein [Myxococcaceae bacterium]